MHEAKRVSGLLLLLVMLLWGQRADVARAQELHISHDYECGQGSGNCFVETDGSTLSAHRAYEALHRPSQPHHLRAFFEEVTYLTVGTTWYWLARKQNLVDWDRPSAAARFTLDVIRLDNNEFPINFTLHPWSGAAYYSAARTNGLSLWASAGYAFGATLAWEYGIEFREKVSFNDLIATPLPAITLGEFFSRLALYVNRPVGKPSRWQRAAGWLFGPLQAFSDAFEPKQQYGEGPRDNLGFSAHQHHAFRMHLGLAQQRARRNDTLLADVGVDGSFTAIPSYGRPGRIYRFIHDGDFLRFWLSHIQGSDGAREFDSYADLTLLGVYQQRIDRALHGGSIFLGSSLGYRYRRSFFKGFRDEVSATHLPGFALEAQALFGPQYALRVSYRLHPDFAGVRALAADDWQAAHPDEEGKTVVEKHGYLYAFGVTSLLELSLRMHKFELGGRSWFAAYNSKEGLDRSQEEITADPKGFDRVIDSEGYVRLTPFDASGFLLELSLLSRRRVSQLGGFERRADLLRGSFRTGFSF